MMRNLKRTNFLDFRFHSADILFLRFMLIKDIQYHVTILTIKSTLV